MHTAINVGSDIAPLRKPLRFQMAEICLRMRLTQIVADKMIRKALLGKKIRFVRFNHEKIIKSRYVLNKNKINDAFCAAYDYYICGSDQIWNPEFHFNSSVEYLPRVSAEKKLTYAASFGVQTLSGEAFEFAHRNIQTFRGDHLSVREDSALNILKMMGVAQASVVLDPTLLLDKDKWLQLEQVPEFTVPETYVLSYMLGNAERAEAQCYADENGMELIDIYNTNNYDHYAIGPREFVYLIRHASAIYTDSFHAMVFSVIFHKELRLYMRTGMTSRIETLMKMIGRDEVLKTRRLKDYEGVDERIRAGRQKSIEFLKTRIAADI